MFLPQNKSFETIQFNEIIKNNCVRQIFDISCRDNTWISKFGVNSVDQNVVVYSINYHPQNANKRTIYTTNPIVNPNL